MAVTRIVLDRDCPKCAWPETYSEVDEDTVADLGPIAIGCAKCGHREEAFAGLRREDGKRVCFYIPHGQRDEHGYIPSLVTESEPGHSPLSGDPKKFQTPWHWGDTYERAEEIARDANARLGHTEDDVFTIICSSMAASH